MFQSTLKAMGLLFAALFASAANGEDQAFARLGDAAVSENDVRAALLTVEPEQRDGLLRDPNRVGNLLKTLLLRRAMVDEAEQWLGPEKIAAIEAESRQATLARLALEFLSRTEDERAVEQLARRLHAQVEPEKVFDLTLVAVPAAAYGWSGAAEEAAKVHRSLEEDAEGIPSSLADAEQGDGLGGGRYQVPASDLNPRLLRVLESLSPGELSEPFPIEIGYVIVRLHQQDLAPVPSFEASRERWMYKARLELARQGRQQLEALHDERSLADMALQAGLHQGPIGEAYLRTAREESLLAAYKESYLEAEMPNIDPLVRERYTANRSEFMTPPTGDVALVRVAGVDTGRLSQWQETLEDHVRSSGITDFVQQVTALTGAGAVRSNVNRDVPLKILETDDLEVVARMISENRRVGVDVQGPVATFIAVENYRQPRQRAFDEIEENLRETVREEMAEIIWRRKTEPYHQLALEADPDRIAALRTLESPG